MIEHLVLISGLKGAGKTTFFNLLAKEEVTADIVERVFGGNNPDTYSLQPLMMETRCTPDQLSEMGRNLIVQTNPRIVLKGGYGTYDKVPFFDILKHAKKVSVVTVQPDSKKLAEQWWKRRVETAAKTSFARSVMVSINYRLQPFMFWRKFQNKHTTKILYRFPNEIEKIYDDWRAFMRASESSTTKVDLIDITTVGDNAGPGSFVMVDKKA